MEKEFINHINKHTGILYKICNTYFFNNPNKEDYYQEILIRLWKAYPKYRSQSTFSTWMYRVALNSAIDIIRKISIQPKFFEISSRELNIPNNRNEIVSDDQERLYQAINQLSFDEKAIALLYLEDYTYDEIATIIGISRNNVGVKINRIKKELFKKINHDERK